MRFPLAGDIARVFDQAPTARTFYTRAGKRTARFKTCWIVVCGAACYLRLTFRY